MPTLTVNGWVIHPSENISCDSCQKLAVLFEDKEYLCKEHVREKREKSNVGRPISECLGLVD